MPSAKATRQRAAEQLADRAHTILQDKPFTYTTVHELVDLLITSYFKFDQPRSPHDIPPAEFIRITQSLSDDACNRDGRLWKTLGRAFMQSHHRPMTAAEEGMIVENLAARLAHEVNFRLDPDIDAPARQQLGFDSEIFRQTALARLNHWAAKANYHPVHQFLQHSVMLSPAMQPLAEEAARSHILNPARIEKLEADFTRTLARLKREQVRFTPYTSAASDIAKQISDFSFYAVEGATPVDHQPLPFVNKALEILFDMRYAAHPNHQSMPRRYHTRHPYSVLQAFNRAFENVNGYPPPDHAIRLVANETCKRMEHEVFQARFKDNGPDDALNPPLDVEAKAWFNYARRELRHGRAFVLDQMIDRMQGHDLDRKLIHKLAGIMLEHALLNDDHQWRLNHYRFESNGRAFFSGDPGYNVMFDILTATARKFQRREEWMPFITAYAKTHDGQLPDAETLGRLKESLQGQIKETALKTLAHSIHTPQPTYNLPINLHEDNATLSYALFVALSNAYSLPISLHQDHGQERTDRDDYTRYVLQARHGLDTAFAELARIPAAELLAAEPDAPSPSTQARMEGHQHDRLHPSPQPGRSHR